ncbi:GNAT family N-acetyltransferase [Thalassotalea sp. PLHSN55]|uniref:GNAT family N-acetyltransferase n=1 Tax=Thalassotalea sp. PLHSN55 TaxID=3435888 RepID=UPI003F82A613
MKITCIQADYHNDKHGEDLLFLLNAYAQDPMGGGEPLAQYTQEHLISALQKANMAFSVICYVGDQPAGLINCMEGFSTFAAKPLVNIHDVVVAPKFRGQSISTIMLAEVEKIAKNKGCCKLTLEVLQGNEVAQKAYQKVGFSGYELDPTMGQAVFWQKKL